MPCEQILNNTFTFEMYVEENNIDIDDLDDEDTYYTHYFDWYNQTPEGIQERLDYENQLESEDDINEEEERYYNMNEEDQYYYRLENNLDTDLNPLPNNIDINNFFDCVNYYINNFVDNEPIQIKRSPIIVDSDSDDDEPKPIKRSPIIVVDSDSDDE
jgi:hypothetical protein